MCCSKAQNLASSIILTDDAGRAVTNYAGRIVESPIRANLQSVKHCKKGQPNLGICDTEGWLMGWFASDDEPDPHRLSYTALDKAELNEVTRRFDADEHLRSHGF